MSWENLKKRAAERVSVTFEMSKELDAALLERAIDEPGCTCRSQAVRAAIEAWVNEPSQEDE